MVKGGYAWNNAPPRNPRNTNNITSDDDDWDWSYKYSNAKLLKLARTTSIFTYCEKQHYKFIAHTTRHQNYKLQKMLSFATPRCGQQTHWMRLSKNAQIEPMQLRKITRVVNFTNRPALFESMH